MQHLLPVILDGLHIDGPADQLIERGEFGVGRKRIEPPLAEVANTRGKPEPQQMAKPEHMIDSASGVGGMLLDLQLALMVEQAIDDMRRLAGIGGDDLVVKWSIAV